MSSLDALLSRIVAPDPHVALAAHARLERLTKPPGSLGRLETLAARVALITGQAMPRVAAPVIFTLVGDHGVVTEGVSAYPQAVTAQMVENFCQGGAAVNALGRHVGARVVVADLGVAVDLGPRPGLELRKIARGTRNFAEGPAMTREEALAAIAAGAALVEDAAPDCIGTGEMGIGNTTAASALTAALTGADPAAVTGRGTGVDDAAWARKVAVIRRGLGTNRPDPRDGLGVLAAVGGLEIAGLVGVVLAGAARRVPVVLDGFIATAAALVAVRLRAEVREYLIAAHRSAEPGHGVLLETLGLAPYLDLGMRLGEGTGAALGIGLIRAALACYTDMATFKEAGVSGRLP
ncbi:MAG TPA: nicotinate-nucleotide--dimethylbenzimidazole phosphoribosyltransferase [Methylomirabilota bacterium]|nr:nicotinate-nucleotide--dimethylbenzimidazole phosphoribosyltransferase [Methylomirabilota bacterium]